MDKLKEILKTLLRIWLKLGGYCVRCRNMAFRKIDATYDEALRIGKFTLRDSLVVNWFIALSHVFSIEFGVALGGTFGVLAITGAFGTDSTNLVIPALAYWAALMFLSAVSLVIAWIIVGPFHHIYRLSYWAVVPAYILLSSIFVSLAAYNFAPLVLTTKILPFHEILFPVIGLVSLGTLFLQRTGFEKTNFLRYAESNESNRLMAVLPVHLRGRILAVSAQDHYISITTDKGKHLHRMGLSEALQMLPPHDGIHIHRSHWVNKSAIQSVNKSGNRNLVMLDNQEVLPVSNAKIDEVREATGQVDNS